MMSGAVKKIPASKVRSSQRPMTTPMRTGVTIAHPRTPICPSRAANEGSALGAGCFGARLRPERRLLHFFVAAVAGRVHGAASAVNGPSPSPSGRAPDLR